MPSWKINTECKTALHEKSFHLNDIFMIWSIGAEETMGIKMKKILFFLLLICSTSSGYTAEKQKDQSIFERNVELKEKAYKNFQRSKYLFDDICYPQDHSGDYLDFYEYFGCLRKSYEFIDLAFKNNAVHSSMIDTLQNTKPYSSSYLCLYEIQICAPLDLSKDYLLKKEEYFVQKKQELSASVAKKEGYTKANLREMWMRRAVMEKGAYEAMLSALDYLDNNVDHPDAEHIHDICRFQLVSALETDNDNAYLVQAIKSLCKPFFEIRKEGVEESVRHDKLKEMIDKAYKMYMVVEMLKFQEEYVYEAGK